MQDPEARSQKVGLTAAKVELDARPLNEATLGAALRSNQFFGLTAALLEVRQSMSPCRTSRQPGPRSCSLEARADCFS